MRPGPESERPLPSDGTPYGEEFYSGQIAGSARSARTILALLFEIYRPRSVVDVGCGRGAWLSAAESLGASKLTGYEGPWVTSSSLLSGRIELHAVDLEGEFHIAERHDLAISVEVAEHLSERRAAAFVAKLCGASDLVVFSAAIKHQGGTNHVNEQYQSYWARLFESQGFECFDIFRPFVWSDETVEWWYRQNTLLWMNRCASPPPVPQAALQARQRPILDIVHPRNYERLQLNQAPTSIR